MWLPVYGRSRAARWHRARCAPEAVCTAAGAPVLAAAGGGLGPGGATLIADEAVAAELWARLLAEVRECGLLVRERPETWACTRCSSSLASWCRRAGEGAWRSQPATP